MKKKNYTKLVLLMFYLTALSNLYSHDNEIVHPESITKPVASYDTTQTIQGLLITDTTNGGGDSYQEVAD